MFYAYVVLSILVHSGCREKPISQSIVSEVSKSRVKPFHPSFPPQTWMKLFNKMVFLQTILQISWSKYVFVLRTFKLWNNFLTSSFFPVNTWKTLNIHANSHSKHWTPTTCECGYYLWNTVKSYSASLRDRGTHPASHFSWPGFVVRLRAKPGKRMIISIFSSFLIKLWPI